MFVAEWRACPLRALCLALPYLFEQEVLKRLDPTDRTMLAQVGRPWLAAVLISGLPRLPRGETVRLRLERFCASVERLTWAKANGCPWVGAPRADRGWCSPCALAAAAGAGARLLLEHMDLLRCCYGWVPGCATVCGRGSTAPGGTKERVNAPQ